MQRTRLNTLISGGLERLVRWLSNPWRRISLLIISILLGVALGGSLTVIAGQRGDQDITGAVVVVLVAEVISWAAYRRSRRDSPAFLLDLLNALKFGTMYSLALEAFKLGS